ncbi:serine/threonine-protein kinase PRP4 homolog [Plodia interpunctella]|uniref:serine/threonine-protein kinase PRP4 homolog n=1 Tax=Plodia interpunctella TaxID=58824 RepID=UPI0023687CDB|nr:serine/threonine-protein kinase PRP4 homolog [Plodia interpunctella]XP_053615168.1 serine/threonine-protein kinase PRP4 homolog [Plodia interpunctella]XP_053615169.1 serine/threonine-protein kinase PRP4 homolog [Plodia interpunctella]XP_053615170.1 serine/threonine-protein kinase PRP4 homolog [Plodia interpunctella]XP_053615171.1 serine/threonine-protein kinase PRP4 homolog [Plodia interpunctella]XP_053615172.1 serine/threonine-protein kinase PRP4 homolog [Plodia interpunctella]XP_05361517
MAEIRHYKSKSSRSFREEAKKNKSRRKHHRDTDTKHHYSDAKTPPLPATIEDLLKKRDSLKEELTKISDNNIRVVMTEHKIYNKDNSSRVHCKRHSNDKNKPTSLQKKSRKSSDVSPELSHDYTHLDSEDEESIIEKRRLQRKQLLEKLVTSCNDKHKGDKLIENKQIKKTNNEVQEKKIASKPKPFPKEVPDMFSEKDDFGVHNISDHVKQDKDNNVQLTDNWDDSDGYYNTTIGDIIDNRYTIKGILGQGVFANVVRAQDNKNKDTNVAIKIIRNNEMMYKVGLKEISLIKEINKADQDNKYHCVQLISHFKHKGHLCLVLEPLYMDLRGVIKKYGRHGLNMKALMSYSRQLMLALRLLKKLGILHSDIKPDNILVNERKNILKLCDFGSASKLNENEPTPYLVSRFYRAPEIILGLPYNHGVDMWSAGCTIFEMATGKILFTGSSNNKMLKCFMDFKGKIPSRLIKRGKFKDQHFNYNNNFLMHKRDEATHREKHVEITNITATKDLYTEMQKACKNLTAEEEKKLPQLKDFLDKIFMFDPNHRPSILDCLKHPFIRAELEK